MPLTLTRLNRRPIDVDVPAVHPSSVEGKSKDAVANLPIVYGNRTTVLKEAFEIEGETSSGEVIWRGDLHGVHSLGAEMDSGRMIAWPEGDSTRSIGHRAAASMSGGELIIEGSTADSLGCSMRGGVVRVHGSCGRLCGGAPLGQKRGMNGGVILISGDVGQETGYRMRRGLIAFQGNAGPALGYNLLAGTIIGFGDLPPDSGSLMVRGTLVGFSSEEPPLLFHLARSGTRPLVVMRMLNRQLHELGFNCPDFASQAWTIDVGDVQTGSRGEVLWGRPP